MVYYSRWSWRKGSSSRSTRRWNTGARRRALGQSRAARHQKDTATVVINRIASVPVQIAAGEKNAAVAINLWDELRQSDFFPNYAPMYDQVKMDRARLKFTGNQSGSAQTANLSPAVVLAFDRNGLDEAQDISVPVISTYSSAQLKQWSTGNSFVMYQTVYPSTIMEKGQYVPCQSLEAATTDDTVDNPCVNQSSNTLPFKPISLLGVEMGVTVDAINTFVFTVEYEFTVTFRGMRKPSIQYSDSVYSLSDFTVVMVQGTTPDNPSYFLESVPEGYTRYTIWNPVLTDTTLSASYGNTFVILANNYYGTSTGYALIIYGTTSDRQTLSIPVKAGSYYMVFNVTTTRPSGIIDVPSVYYDGHLFFSISRQGAYLPSTSALQLGKLDVNN